MIRYGIDLKLYKDHIGVGLSMYMNRAKVTIKQIKIKRKNFNVFKKYH